MDNMDDDEKVKLRKIVLENKRNLRRLNFASTVILAALIPVILTIASIKYKFEGKIGDTVVQLQSEGWIAELRDWVSILLPVGAAGAGWTYYRGKGGDDDDEPDDRDQSV